MKMLFPILGLMAAGSLLAHTPSSPDWTSANSFGGSGSDLGQAVKGDRNGNVYVTGAFSTTASFPLRAGDKGNRTSLTSRGGTDIFLAKYDSSGKLKWLTYAGGTEDDIGFDLAFDGAGNVYVTGEFSN